MPHSPSNNYLVLNQLVTTFYSLFTNKNQQRVELEKIFDICIPTITIIKKVNTIEEIYDIHSFIKPRLKILSDGTLTEFSETEINEVTKISGNIGQRFSTYQKDGYLNGIYFEGKGTKLFQFVKTITGWKICSVIWEDEI